MKINQDYKLAYRAGNNAEPIWNLPEDDGGKKDEN